MRTRNSSAPAFIGCILPSFEPDRTVQTIGSEEHISRAPASSAGFIGIEIHGAAVRPALILAIQVLQPPLRTAVHAKVHRLTSPTVAVARTPAVSSLRLVCGLRTATVLIVLPAIEPARLRTRK